MKNKKGFTLAELLGVLTLMAIITVITVPLVNSYIKSSREKAYKASIKTIEKAAGEWMMKYAGYAFFEADDTFYLSIEGLKNSEFLSDDDIIDPRNENNELSGCVAIKKKNYTYAYEYINDCPLAYTPVIEEEETPGEIQLPDIDLGKEYLFEYTGDCQTWTVPSKGTYKLEVWGASGGKGIYNSTQTSFAKGGYSKGSVVLTKGTTLYIYVGGEGRNSAGNGAELAGGFNGGGNVPATSYTSSGGGSGGGATHIATKFGLLYTLESYKSEVLIVAGGAGGWGYTNDTTAGYGGGQTGGTGIGTSASDASAPGGTQTGTSVCSGSYGGICGATGSFGKGGDGGMSSSNKAGGGAGGGGWYGGTGGKSGSSIYAKAGGGGSGYVKSTLIDAVTYSGNSSFSNINGTGNETGHTGNGYAKITKIAN